MVRFWAKSFREMGSSGVKLHDPVPRDYTLIAATAERYSLLLRELPRLLPHNFLSSRFLWSPTRFQFSWTLPSTRNLVWLFFLPLPIRQSNWGIKRSEKEVMEAATCSASSWACLLIALLSVFSQCLIVIRIPNSEPDQSDMVLLSKIQVFEFPEKPSSIDTMLPSANLARGAWMVWAGKKRAISSTSCWVLLLNHFLCMFY